MTIKLEIGRYYRTRDGRKAEWRYSGDPGNPLYPVKVKIEGQDFWLSYTGNGGYWCDGEEHPMDLIAEWDDEIGTLAELNVRVGDVVEWVGLSGLMCLTYEITEIDRGLHISDGRTLSQHPHYRIVSRATPAQSGPVITETVTRKRIVPGAYGKVRIEVDGEHVKPFVEFTGYVTRADLIAARDVFNQLIDALADSGAT